MTSGGRYKMVARATLVGAAFGIVGLLASTSTVNAAPLGISTENFLAGEIRDLGGGLLTDWDVVESIIANPTFSNSSTGASVTTLHEGYATGGTSAGSPIALHSRSLIQIDTGGAKIVKAFGSSSIILTDSLRVSDGPGFGELRMTWEFHARNRVFIDTSDPAPIFLKDQRFNLGTRAGGVLTAAGTSLAPQRLGLLWAELSNIASIPSVGSAFSTFYDPSELLFSRDTFRPAEDQRDFVSDRTVVDVAVFPLSGPTGNFTEVEFSLLSGYSAYFDRIDSNPLFTINDADLGSTATLVSVELLNPDGTPYIGDWSLTSAAGYVYPIIVRSAVDPGDPAAVPAPAAGLLMLAALRRRAA